MIWIENQPNMNQNEHKIDNQTIVRHFFQNQKSMNFHTKVTEKVEIKLLQMTD